MIDYRSFLLDLIDMLEAAPASGMTRMDAIETILGIGGSIGFYQREGEMSVNIDLPPFENDYHDYQSRVQLECVRKQDGNLHHFDLMLSCLRSLASGPAHKHDCDECTYIGTFPRRHGGWADVWLSCERSDFAYIVRYGTDGSYATTSQPSRYCFCALIGPSVSDYELERKRSWAEMMDPSDVPDMLTDADDLPLLEDIFDRQED